MMIKTCKISQPIAIGLMVLGAFMASLIGSYSMASMAKAAAEAHPSALVEALDDSDLDHEAQVLLITYLIKNHAKLKIDLNATGILRRTALIKMLSKYDDHFKYDWYPQASAARYATLALLNSNPSYGLDIDAYDALGETALYMAVDTGNKQMVAALLERGANPNAPITWYKWFEYTWRRVFAPFTGPLKKDLTDKVPLILAVKNQDYEMVKLLVENENTLINAKNTAGHTALYWAHRIFRSTTPNTVEGNIAADILSALRDAAARGADL